jgi:tRNA A37 threonylcarbamoyltransferase TsaD
LSIFVSQAYDKTARLLGLDLSKGGGPALEALAREGDDQRFKFSIPMRASKTGAKTCDFSYAGGKDFGSDLCICILGIVIRNVIPRLYLGSGYL